MPERAQPPGDPCERTRRLFDLTSKLTETADLEVLATQLVALRKDLVEHFESEEAADGLFDEIAAKSPHQSYQLDRLRQEHRGMIDQIDKLTQQVGGCRQDITRTLVSFKEQLEQHESDEIELLSETLSVDYGGQG